MNITVNGARTVTLNIYPGPTSISWAILLDHWTSDGSRRRQVLLRGRIDRQEPHYAISVLEALSLAIEHAQRSS